MTMPLICRTYSQSTPPVCGCTSTALVRAPAGTQGDLLNYRKYPDDPALADQACSPITVVLSAVQAGDNPMLWPVLTARKATSTATFRLLADKAYSHDSTRTRLRLLKIAHTIPERSDQIARRKAKGAKGVCPPSFSGKSTRNATPSNSASTGLKHWRAVATRYDKYALTYLGGVTLAAIVTYHRVRN